MFNDQIVLAFLMFQIKSFRKISRSDIIFNLPSSPVRFYFTGFTINFPPWCASTLSCISLSLFKTTTNWKIQNSSSSLLLGPASNQLETPFSHLPLHCWNPSSLLRCKNHSFSLSLTPPRPLMHENISSRKSREDNGWLGYNLFLNHSCKFTYWINFCC